MQLPLCFFHTHVESVQESDLFKNIKIPTKELHHHHRPILKKDRSGAPAEGFNRVQDYKNQASQPDGNTYVISIVFYTHVKFVQGIDPFSKNLKLKYKRPHLPRQNCPDGSIQCTCGGIYHGYKKYNSFL